MQELTQTAPVQSVQTAAALRIVEAEPETVDLSRLKLSVVDVVCQLDLNAFFVGNHLLGLKGASAYEDRELCQAREHMAKVIAFAKLLKDSL